jgi:cytoskeleton protein RodZ
MSTLGQELRREREKSAVSLKDISDRTKISLRYLEALETGDYKALPGPFFIKSILRAYAKDFGLDEDYFYALYRQETRPEIGAEAAPGKPAPRPPTARRRAKPHRRAALAFGLAGLILLGAAAAVYVYILKPQRNPAPIIPAPYAAAPALPPLADPEVPPVVEFVAKPDGADLKLELMFTAETWIYVAADGAVQLNGTWKAGERATCTAKKEFLLHTGNAGGFTLSLNGRALKPLSAPGRVLTDVRIDRGTLSGVEAASDKPPAGKAER